MRPQRSQSFGFNPRLVYERVIEIGNLAGIRSRRGVGLRNLLDQVGRALVAEIGKLRKYIDLGAIRGNLRALDPIAIGIVIEIVSRLYRTIDVGRSDSVRLGRGIVLREGSRRVRSERTCGHAQRCEV